MIKILRFEGEKLNISLAEILRYAGCKKNADEHIVSLIKKCENEILPKIVCKACYDEFNINFNENLIDLGFAKVKSTDLKKNLDGCEKIILFAATIGIEMDRCIQKYSLLSPSNALIAQAVGAAAIEAWCDKLCEIFAKEKEPLFLRPRFSPGYGDLSLDIQNDILTHLDCARKIGLTATKNLMMTPIKSVTAIVGLSEVDFANCHTTGCGACKNKNCGFKKEQ